MSSNLSPTKKKVIILILMMVGIYLLMIFTFDSKEEQVLYNPNPINRTPNKADVKRAVAVRKGFQHAWKGYSTYAWGSDDFHPNSKHGSDWFGISLMIVDSLDTIWLMGLKDEFQEGQRWVEKNLRFDIDSSVSVFEVTIRELGGLLSAYAWSQEKVFLDKAIDLGDRLIGAFNSPSGIPYGDLHLKNGRSNGNSQSNIAEIATLQLEFKYLSYASKNPKYAQIMESVMNKLDKLPKFDGLLPIFISPETGQVITNFVSLGARGDSYYEYLIKQWMLTNKVQHKYRRMWDESVVGIKKYLVERTKNQKLVYIAELPDPKNPQNKNHRMDHLVCFLPAVLALGATKGEKVWNAKLSDVDKEDLKLAEELVYTCYQMYEKTATGLGPEVVYFEGYRAVSENSYIGDDLKFFAHDRFNILRPEVVESIYYMWYLTEDPKYREWGWKIFEAFQRYSRVENGYCGVSDVFGIPPDYRDKMETFFLAETMKYLYLLFADPETVPLNKYVFNTEAHPFPILNDVDITSWDLD